MTASAALTLILGGARSGKSAYAEELASHATSLLYVATAEPLDDDMRDRIAAHRAQRPPHWHTLEAPRNLGNAVRAALAAAPAEFVLVDCLTLLASNIILTLPEPVEQAAADAVLRAEIDSLLTAQAASQARWIMVSNEVGLGVVPSFPLGRIYRDALGRANQRVAAAADAVFLMVAGLPLQLK